MEKFNYKDLFVQAIKEGAEEHEPGEKKIREYRDEIFDGQKKGRYKKIKAAMQTLLEYAPEMVSEKIKDFLKDEDYSKLPFDLDHYDFQERIGKGGISKVHLLQAKNENEPSYVVKVDYHKRGSVDELQKKAQEQHEEYEEISGIYREIEDFVPREQTIITTDKKNDTPVIATIQEYFGKNIRDIFTEIKKENLLALLKDNHQFRREFIEFSDITLDLASEKNKIIDFLGNKNLCVIEAKGIPHLKFIDPHTISSTESDDKERIERLQESLEYIKDLRDAAVSM